MTREVTALSIREIEEVHTQIVIRMKEGNDPRTRAVQFTGGKHYLYIHLDDPSKLTFTTSITTDAEVGGLAVAALIRSLMDIYGSEVLAVTLDKLLHPSRPQIRARTISAFSMSIVSSEIHQNPAMHGVLDEESPLPEPPEDPNGG